MIKVNNKEFLAALRSGDIGLILGKNLFASLQNIYRKRFNEGPERASHGFIMRDPPVISEANGVVIRPATILKNVGDSTKCWLFRYTKLTPEQAVRMNVYAQSAEDTAGHYSVGGILQFAKAFFTGKKEIKDEGGVFCTEFTSRIIQRAGIMDYIVDRDPWEIDPSSQLNWFLTEGPKCGWILAASYDGNGNYFIADELAAKRSV